MKTVYRDRLVAALDLKGRTMSMIGNPVRAVPVFIPARSPDFSGVGDIPDLVADAVGV